MSKCGSQALYFAKPNIDFYESYRKFIIIVMRHLWIFNVCPYKENRHWSSWGGEREIETVSDDLCETLIPCVLRTMNSYKLQQYKADTCSTFISCHGSIIVHCFFPSSLLVYFHPLFKNKTNNQTNKNQQ